MIIIMITYHISICYAYSFIHTLGGNAYNNLKRINESTPTKCDQFTCFIHIYLLFLYHRFEYETQLILYHEARTHLK